MLYVASGWGKQVQYVLSFMLALRKQTYFIDRDGKHFPYILNFLRVCDCLVLLN